MTDGEHTAVIDRIVDDQAVLLVGDHEQELTVPAADLPDGSREGSWLRVRLETRVVVLGPADPEVDEADLAERLANLRRQRSRRFGH